MKILSCLLAVLLLTSCRHTITEVAMDPPPGDLFCQFGLTIHPDGTATPVDLACYRQNPDFPQNITVMVHISVDLIAM